MKTPFLFFLMLFASACLSQNRVILDRKNDNSIYINDATMFMGPGDTVMLVGKYSGFKIYNIHGTAEKPVVFINKGPVTIDGGTKNMVILSGNNFKVLGNGDAQRLYGISISPTKMNYPYFGIMLENSSNVEIAFCEINKVANGIMQVAPAEKTSITNCSYHDNYIHDIGNADIKKSSNAIVLGNLNSLFPFENCMIENNILENISGNGIKVTNGTFTVQNNHLKKFGTANMHDCRSGIMFAEQSTGRISNNAIDSTIGTALSIFGVGKIDVMNNVFKHMNCSDIPEQDIVFIQSKEVPGKASPLLQINFKNNTIQGKASGYAVRSITPSTLTKGSVFSTNNISGSFKKKYFTSAKDVVK